MRPASSAACRASPTNHASEQETVIILRLPRRLAEAALAAWEREDADENRPAAEATQEQARVRAAAATLALIGSCLAAESTVVDGEDFVVWRAPCRFG